MTADNQFERAAQVSSGTNQLIVKAKDYSGNERTNTYEVLGLVLLVLGWLADIALLVGAHSATEVDDSCPT